MRLFPRPLRTFTATFLIAHGCILHVVPAAAGFAPSKLSGVTAIASSRDGDVIAIERALENKQVAQKLRDYGVRPEGVQARLATMSDADLHTLATASRGLPSGGDGLGALIGVLVIVLLVIVILKLLNKEVIIK